MPQCPQLSERLYLDPLRLLCKLYKFLARRTDSKFNKVLGPFDLAEFLVSPVKSLRLQVILRRQRSL